jgi:SAM-dependent methyltransferase
MIGWLTRALLAHPLARGVDPDGPDAAGVHSRLIAKKPVLRRVYDDWYRAIQTALPPASARVLEIGSGTGALACVLPRLIKSDIRPTPDLGLRLDACRLPFADACLEGIVMTNVLHHLPRPRDFLRDAARTLSIGGRLIMIEPWVSRWSSVVYRRFHHEPFDTLTADWGFPPGRPMTAANGALPWIIFQRDRVTFDQEFPTLEVERIEPGWPFSYLLSGGVSMRSMVPAAAARMLCDFERKLDADTWAMFALIVIRRRGAGVRALKSPRLNAR